MEGTYDVHLSTLRAELLSSSQMNGAAHDAMIHFSKYLHILVLSALSSASDLEFPYSVTSG